MQPWKKESKSFVSPIGTQDPAPKPVAVEPPKPQPFKIFRCEKDQLEQELNERFPTGNVDIVHIAHFGSAVDVVVKIR